MQTIVQMRAAPAPAACVLLDQPFAMNSQMMTDEEVPQAVPMHDGGMEVDQGYQGNASPDFPDQGPAPRKLRATDANNFQRNADIKRRQKKLKKEQRRHQKRMENAMAMNESVAMNDAAYDFGEWK